MTKTVDNHTSKNTYEIPGNFKESIQAMVDLGGQVVGIKKIAEQRGVTKQAVSKHFPEIIEQGLIQKQGKQKPFTYKLNGEGYRVLEDPPYGSGSVDNIVDNEKGSNGSGSDGLVRRLHGLTAVAEVQRGGVIPESWMGRLRSEERVHRSESNGSNDCCVWTNRFFIRLHKSSCTVQVREGCSFDGETVSEVFLSFHEELLDLLDWVERVSKVSLQLDFVDLRGCELAFEGHHLAKLVKEVSGLDLNDFFVEDDDLGKEVLTLDDSFGPELESKSGERAEEIGYVVEQELNQYVENPGAVERRHGLENELMVQEVSGQELVRKVNKVEQVEEEINSVKQVLKDNKDTREAVHEQVRAVNELAQRNQELIESEVVQGEDSRDVVEETIQHVLDEDRFSSPGLQYGNLMAWDVEEQECRKLLDKAIVQKSDCNLLELVDQWKP